MGDEIWNSGLAGAESRLGSGHRKGDIDSRGSLVRGGERTVTPRRRRTHAQVQRAIERAVDRWFRQPSVAQRLEALQRRLKCRWCGGSGNYQVSGREVQCVCAKEER